jgi:hypothetical protein
MKYQDLEDEWTESWNRMILYSLENPGIYKHLICRNNSILTDNALPPSCEDLSKNCNLTFEFIKEYPNIPWDWEKISKHPSITLEIVNENPTLPWDWDYLMENPNITPEFIIENKHLPWELSEFGYAMSKNPHFTYDCIKKYENYLINDTEYLWSHPNITLDNLKQNEFEWGMTWAGDNPNLTIKYVCERHCQMVDNDYAPYVPAVPETLLDDWDWDEVWSSIKDFNDFADLGVYYLDKKNYRGYSENGWGKRALSDNPNLPWEIIEKYHEQPWDWELLSKHPSVTWQHVLENPQFPWVEKCFLANPNLSWEFIKSNKVLFELCLFHEEEISLNPNITPHIVLGYPEIDWDINMLAKNHMEKGREKWIHEQRIRHIKAFQIQCIWRKCSCDPTYKLGQRLIIFRYNK